jgi:hypothetical protein
MAEGVCAKYLLEPGRCCRQDTGLEADACIVDKDARVSVASANNLGDRIDLVCRCNITSVVTDLLA